jgi:hypothetical protein
MLDLEGGQVLVICFDRALANTFTQVTDCRPLRFNAGE